MRSVFLLISFLFLYFLFRSCCCVRFLWVQEMRTADSIKVKSKLMSTIRSILIGNATHKKLHSSISKWSFFSFRSFRIHFSLVPFFLSVSIQSKNVSKMCILYFWLKTKTKAAKEMNDVQGIDVRCFDSVDVCCCYCCCCCVANQQIIEFHKVDEFWAICCWPIHHISSENHRYNVRYNCFGCTKTARAAPIYLMWLRLHPNVNQKQSASMHNESTLNCWTNSIKWWKTVKRSVLVISNGF